MIPEIMVVMLYVVVVFLVGMWFGQHLLLNELREEHIIIKDWCYSAAKVKEEEYKRWN